jgi:hypothetical protein
MALDTSPITGGPAMGRSGWLLMSLILAAALGAQPAGAEIRIATAGPMTGDYAWAGDRYQRGAGLAVADLNARGGVLGQKVELIVGDDFCDPEQALALARKLVSDRVAFVAGHWCSHASIAAAKIYERAKILMISPGSASAKLTDEGGPNVFRGYGRDDRQGIKVADYIATRWAGKQIAILDDGTVWGWLPRTLASSPAQRPKERSSLIPRTRAAAPKRRRSSSGSECQVSNRGVTPCTLMAPFRCGRRRPRKPARWNSRRRSHPCGNTSSTPS